MRGEPQACNYGQLSMKVDDSTAVSQAYPPSRTVNQIEELAGVTFADPFRWLEENSAEVTEWQRAQNDLAAGYSESWGPFGRLATLVKRFHVDRRISLPRFAGGRWFGTFVPEGASQSAAYVADTPDGEKRIILDPRAKNADHPPFLSWISPSPDGRLLAVGVCTDGSEKNRIALVDVTSGVELPGAPAALLMDNWTGGVHWFSDSSGFFFSALTGAESEFDQAVFLYRQMAPGISQKMDIPWLQQRSYRMVTVSRDGIHAVAFEGFDNPLPVAVARLDRDRIVWKPFIRSDGESVSGHVVGDRLIAVTYRGAPRGRVVAIPLDAADPDDRDCWVELVPESDAVLRGVTLIGGDRLYVTAFIDSYASLCLFALDGSLLQQVPLPAAGALNELPFPLMNLVPKGHPDKYLFGYTSFARSWAILEHDPDQGGVRTLQPPAVILEDVLVEDRWAVSSDGTRIPYHIVRKMDVDPDEPQPTVIYAYGGFNVPLLPQFPGPLAAIVEAGGVFVHAHLRGGGEFGPAWWNGGRLARKQQSFDDLYAIAEDLIDTGRTCPSMLALTGASNGGLMAAVAAIQRPDLWCAVVPRVPLLDLIGACRDDYDRMCIQSEYADIDDPADVRRLATFSPYHMVADGTAHPAIWLDAGETDPRCPAWHARKLAARLQAAPNGDNPVFLRVWSNVGHGWATDRSIAVHQFTSWIAFLMRQLGLGDRL